ncbi:MAG: hypothetical protein H6736_23000 [Alphaproteobacteria bacterium]|nr:hypothetical protein [Alphaproteobacteria bacterium]
MLAEISATVASLPDIIQRESATARAVESERFEADERRKIREVQREAAMAYLKAVEDLLYLTQMRWAVPVDHPDLRSINSNWRGAYANRMAARRMVRMVLPIHLENVAFPELSSELLPGRDLEAMCVDLDVEADFAAGLGRVILMGEPYDMVLVSGKDSTTSRST